MNLCRSSTRLFLSALVLALCVCARPTTDQLGALLRSDKHQDLLLSSLLLSELLSLENNSVQDPDPDSEGMHVDPGRVHLDPDSEGVHVQRDTLLLAPRERKAGCKNFFWKTFTSC